MMNRTLRVAALLALMLPSMGQANDADVEKEVAKLSNQITGALVNGDTTFLDGALADDWMLISPDGTTEDKAKHLKDVKDGTVKYDAMDMSETKVRVYGDAAVVTGRNQAKLRIKGREVMGNVRFTEVFARRAGKWQVVSVQLTPIAAPSGEKP